MANHFQNKTLYINVYWFSSKDLKLWFNLFDYYIFGFKLYMLEENEIKYLVIPYIPVHSLLLVKSIPRMRFDDSRPSFLNAVVTCKELYLKLLLH